MGRILKLGHDDATNSAVIPGTNAVRSPVRCELLRASKDGRTHCAEQHPSRRSQAAAPQDDASCCVMRATRAFRRTPETFLASARPQYRLRVNGNLPSEFNLIWGVQTSSQKYFCLRQTQITCVLSPSRASKRGVSRSSRTLVRDAVDARTLLTNSV
jgi:hypothetical protein